MSDVTGPWSRPPRIGTPKYTPSPVSLDAGPAMTTDAGTAEIEESQPETFYVPADNFRADPFLLAASLLFAFVLVAKTLVPRVRVVKKNVEGGVDFS